MNLDSAAQLRNFKDFLFLYNRISEQCFAACTDNFMNRAISPLESQCVDSCVEKYAKVNQRILGVYMEVQQRINTKRIEEVEETQRKLEAAKVEESSNKVDTTVSA